MGQVVRVNGDYSIKTSEGGTILLDTGPNVGFVRVTGSLSVEGDTLTVSANDLNIKDNVITINYGEQGAGVSLTYAGMQVDRGSLPSAVFVFDENTDSWIIANGQVETGVTYTNSNLRLRSILTDATTDSGDLTLIGSGTGVLKVVGTTNYEDQVTDDDDIPNKKYVDDAIESAPAFQISRGDTRVIAFDTTQELGSEFFPIGPYVVPPIRDQVAVIINNRRVALFTEEQLEMRGITIFAESPRGSDIFGSPVSDAVTIQATNTNTNLILETTGTGKVQIPFAMQFDNVLPEVSPSPVANSTVLYSGSVLSGGTGLYSVNSVTSGELIIKNRALLYSMIF